jgi:hypothetical protein
VIAPAPTEPAIAQGIAPEIARVTVPAIGLETAPAIAQAAVRAVVTAAAKEDLIAAAARRASAVGRPIHATSTRAAVAMTAAIATAHFPEPATRRRHARLQIAGGQAREPVALRAGVAAVAGCHAAAVAVHPAAAAAAVVDVDRRPDDEHTSFRIAARHR